MQQSYQHCKTIDFSSTKSHNVSTHHTSFKIWNKTTNYTQFEGTAINLPDKSVHVRPLDYALRLELEILTVVISHSSNHFMPPVIVGTIFPCFTHRVSSHPWRSSFAVLIYSRIWGNGKTNYRLVGGYEVLCSFTFRAFRRSDM